MTVPNEHVEHFVAQALLASPELSSQTIDVRANDGVVTLAGAVQSYRQKLQAQQLATACEPVRSVVNNLAVELVDSIPDETIALEVNQHFTTDANLLHQSIRVDSHNGRVTLSGYVVNSEKKKISADIASAINGVRDINNLLIINPDQAMANDELATSIRAAMKGIIGMQNDDFVLSVVDETARISGRVDALWKKEAAEKTVREFGILNVCNEIVVQTDPANPQTGQV